MSHFLLSVLPVTFALVLIASASASGREASAIMRSPLFDLEGRRVDPFRDSTAKLMVFVFVRTDCPISNAYAPEVQRLQKDFTPLGAVFRLVYPGGHESSETIRTHLRAFGYSCEAFRDPLCAFAKRSKVGVVSEAAVFRPDGMLLYHGRIDDRYVDFGKARPQASKRDLAGALAQALAGEPVTPASGPAVGCFIEEAK
ncbi:MAG: hypothetical protein V4710_16805 [Verrucomicrobiota bacterium]